MQSGVSKGKAKGDSNEPMELLDNETVRKSLRHRVYISLI